MQGSRRRKTDPKKGRTKPETPTLNSGTADLLESTNGRSNPRPPRGSHEQAPSTSVTPLHHKTPFNPIPRPKMTAKTAAQEEFDNIFTRSARPTHHPEDRDETEDGDEEIDEETTYKQGKIAETMRLPIYNNRAAPLRLPPPSFDSGCTTGVKGVIADARSFEAAKREGTWKAKVQVTQVQSQEKKLQRGRNRDGESYLMDEDGSDEEFLERWREARRKEIMREGNDIRNRRTSPSIRRYGRFDEVDALGYLDAIERVGRETVVVVFVYDAEVCRSFPLSPPLERSMYSHAVHRHVLLLFLYAALMADKLTIFPKRTVPRQPSHRKSTHGPRAHQPGHPLRQSQLRRDRIR
jgi:hypothetical protein